MRLRVILNGPPDCDNDTLASRMVEYGFQHKAFKTQLYKDTAEHFGLDLNDFIRRATDRGLKETGYGRRKMTPREMLIYTSEEVIKPQYGEGYFGQAAAGQCLMDEAYLAVFSDGGFREEIFPLVDTYDTLVIFRLHRDGCSFVRDSRDYLGGSRTPTTWNWSPVTSMAGWMSLWTSWTTIWTEKSC